MREKIFKNQPRRVVYIYSEKSHFVEELYQEKLIDKAIRQLPTTYEKLEEIVAPFVREGVILIVDDGLSQLHGYLPKIFEEFTSKNNCSVFFVSQSIFVEDKNVMHTLGPGCQMMDPFGLWWTIVYEIQNLSNFS